MNETAIVTQNPMTMPAVMERVIAAGDLGKLSPGDRVCYYGAVCDSIGLNPLTKPFDYLSLSGRLVLYANKGCTDQLRNIRGVSLHGPIDISYIGDHVQVRVEMIDSTGRIDGDVAVVSLKGLQGEAWANAVMKAVTKAKRRATLSLCGLGMLDETEVDTIPYASRMVVTEDGEILADRATEHRRMPAQSAFQPGSRTEPRDELETPRDLLMRRIHASGLSHDELRALAVYKLKKTGRVVTSLAELTETELQGFADYVGRKTEEQLRDELMKHAADEAESGVRDD